MNTASRDSYAGSASGVPPHGSTDSSYHSPFAPPEPGEERGGLETREENGQLSDPAGVANPVNPAGAAGAANPADAVNPIDPALYDPTVSLVGNENICGSLEDATVKAPAAMLDQLYAPLENSTQQLPVISMDTFAPPAGAVPPQGMPIAGDSQPDVSAQSTSGSPEAFPGAGEASESGVNQYQSSAINQPYGAGTPIYQSPPMPPPMPPAIPVQQAMPPFMPMVSPAPVQENAGNSGAGRWLMAIVAALATLLVAMVIILLILLIAQQSSSLDSAGAENLTYSMTPVAVCASGHICGS